MTLLERVARRICLAAGADPDEPVYANQTAESGILYHRWQLYREEAEAAIAETHVERTRKLLAELLEASDALGGGTRRQRTLLVRVRWHLAKLEEGV